MPAQPVLLYFSDIKEDVLDWENRGLCRFYGLEGVRVKDTNEGGDEENDYSDAGGK